MLYLILYIVKQNIKIIISTHLYCNTKNISVNEPQDPSNQLPNSVFIEHYFTLHVWYSRNGNSYPLFNVYFQEVKSSRVEPTKGKERPAMSSVFVERTREIWENNSDTILEIILYTYMIPLISVRHNPFQFPTHRDKFLMKPRGLTAKRSVVSLKSASSSQI